MNYLEDNGLNPEELTSGGKPDESFSQIIKRAIKSSPRQRLFLTEIYSWIQDNYPYFRQIDPGWRVKN
jgi:forkhead transcription factor HCM1